MGKHKFHRRIREIPIWNSDIGIAALSGGRTNENFLIDDGGQQFVVRFGQDIPVHHLLRFNELAASRAAHSAGLSPAVVYAAPGVSVIDYIPNKTLAEVDLRNHDMLARVVPLIKACHGDVARHFRGPALVFWVFHVIRNYAETLTEGGSNYGALVGELLGLSDQLEQASGPFEMVFGHNDLIAANILDDGQKLWLIDWDYAGFGSPMFDLGGLASNCEFDAGLEEQLLELYFETKVDARMLRRFQAMKTASLLRETMWSMVSEITSDLDVDFASYTQENLARFRKALAQFMQS